ncbi:hypothetical protein LJR039_005024 [Pseudorhodoferax sp. LjRoot39]|uniref:hypothetical protein n=1 Tax=Pseudorhodoferax sp. LjRoot39 TaxID=3342328 RepID=UPI003ECE85A6
MTHNPALPVALSLALSGRAWAKRRGIPVLDALAEQSRDFGVQPFQDDTFDVAAAIVGEYYCKALDLYVDRATYERAKGLHFTEAHRALI